MPSNEQSLAAILRYLVQASNSSYPVEIQEALSIIIEEIGQITIHLMPGTRMICSRCFSVNAPGYSLKRSAGKYLAYCTEECANKEIHPNCSFLDHMGVSCDQLAEVQITYGKDELFSKFACVSHVGVLIKDSECKIYPIK